MADTTDSGAVGGSVEIERTVDAPIERVWQMWVDPDHFANWYGPAGARIPTAEFDHRPGGRRFVVMEMDTPDGAMQMALVGEYLEIEEPTRLVYTEAPADRGGRPLSPEEAGMPEGHPATTRVIVRLEARGGETLISLTHEGIPAGSPGEAGWNMALDKLVGLLADG
jgi:uncharacterized protein YndB with AHSA1/START domain